MYMNAGRLIGLISNFGDTKTKSEQVVMPILVEKCSLSGKSYHRNAIHAEHTWKCNRFMQILMRETNGHSVCPA